MILANQIKIGLKTLGITASELARRSGVPKQTISDWQAGVPPRSLPYLKQIASVFGMSVDELVFGAGNEIQSRPPQGNGAHSSNHARVENLVNSFPDMVGYWDANLVNLYANSAYEIFFGLKPEEIRGKTMLELLGPELFEKNRPYVEGALRGEVQIFERDLPTPTGMKHTLAKYLPDMMNGKVCGFSVIVIDISDTK